VEVCPVDDLGERHWRLVVARSECVAIPPSTPPIRPAAVGFLDEVDGDCGAIDVVGGEGLHLGAKRIGRGEEVVLVSLTDTSNDFDLFVGRHFSSPHISVVDDDASDVVSPWVRRSEEGNAKAGREVSLFGTDVVARIPSTAVPSVLCHRMPFRLEGGHTLCGHSVRAYARTRWFSTLFKNREPPCTCLLVKELRNEIYPPQRSRYIIAHIAYIFNTWGRRGGIG